MQQLHKKSKRFKLYCGDNIKTLKKIKDCSVDAVVCDSPYGLGKAPDAYEMIKQWYKTGYYKHGNKAGFMNNAWDSFVPQPIFWKEVYRVLKPGGHVISFFGTRTYDIGTLALRLAGFEIRDQISWIYGNGFPKNQNVSKAIDDLVTTGKFDSFSIKNVNKTRPCKSTTNGYKGFVDSDIGEHSEKRETPKTELGNIWNGWGSALKPAQEPIVLARKPIESTIAKNVLKHGTGAINIDGCRVPLNGDKKQATAGKRIKNKDGGWGVGKSDCSYKKGTGATYSNIGRYPANVIHDGSEIVTSSFPQSNSSRANRNPNNTKRGKNHTATPYGKDDDAKTVDYRDSISTAARFFYCAKASKLDRNYGLSLSKNKRLTHSNVNVSELKHNRKTIKSNSTITNSHPTVKPLLLMSYLCRLITPKNGIILDPFMGSGSTGVSAILEGFRFIGIERELEYFEISAKRVSKSEEDYLINLEKHKRRE